MGFLDVLRGKIEFFVIFMIFDLKVKIVYDLLLGDFFGI